MLSVIFVLFTMVLFAFLGWRVLYLLELDRAEIFGFVFLAPVVFLLVARLAQVVLFWNIWELRLLDIVGFWRKPEFQVLFGYVAMIMFCLYWCWIKKWKVNIVLEELRWPFLIFWLAWVVYNLAMNDLFSFESFLPVVALVLVLIVDLFLSPRYRRVWWYPSGRKGIMFWLLHLVILVTYIIGSIFLRTFGINFYLSCLLMILCLAPLIWLGRI